MGIDVTEEDLEGVEEIGYEVSEVVQEGANLRVKISTPDHTPRIRVVNLGIEHAEQVEYVKDGEVYREPEALKRVRRTIKNELKDLEKAYDYEFDSYDLLSGEQKVIDKCKAIRK